MVASIFNLYEMTHFYNLVLFLLSSLIFLIIFDYLIYLNKVIKYYIFYY
jgi:hypothetical protein